MEWIKVSDRLPEKRMEVIVTIQKPFEKICYSGFYYDPDIKAFVDLVKFESFYNESDESSGIIAWMPLPEPYNGN